MKSFKEKFARFFEEPTREGLREILEVNYGELDSLDFKANWPSLSKMAKHLLAFANSGGGCIIIGVAEENDSFKSKGVKEFLDKSRFHDGVNKFIPEKISYEIINFTFEESEYPDIIGKSFQVLVIENTPQYIPYVSKDNGEGINKNIIYVRKGTKSVKASYEDLQKIMNRRIETNYSTDSEMKLEEHLSQLKILYSQIDSKISSLNETGTIGSFMKSIGKLATHSLGEVKTKDNPAYPDECFDEFVSRMITLKKEKIKKLLLK